MIAMCGCSAYFSTEKMTAFKMGVLGDGQTGIHSPAGRKARSGLLCMKTEATPTKHSCNDRQWMRTCRMVMPLSLLKFQLAQLCPDARRDEISTGGSVQFQGKRFPVDVDRHLKVLDIRVVARRCFDHFQDIDSFDTLRLSFRMRILSTHSLQVSG